MTKPFHQSERNFRRFEATLTELVKRWPIVLKMNPSPLAVETYSCRFRDALRALGENFHHATLSESWETTVPADLFFQHVDEIIVSTAASPGYVVIGPYDLVRKIVPLGTQVEPTTSQTIPVINLQNPDVALIHAVLTLHHYNILIHPSKIETSIDVTNLTPKMDVEIVQTTPNHYVIY